VIADDAEIGADCSIGAYSVIASGAVVGRGVIVQPHVVVGEQAVVGDGAVLFPHVVLYPRTRVGQRVRIHSGSVIGCDGYGYEWTGSAHLKRPHNGRVRIEDDVEIGANVTIDRATTGETVIGPGTKIDNLVQIAHNVRTGAHCLVVSQVGIAGSARLGNGVVLAGQAGVNTHAEVGDGAQVGAGSGIWGKAPPGSFLSGNPARPHREELRIQAALGRLPELLRRVKELERRLEAAGVRSEGGPSDDVG
jgi:UDP-3-O-[3-hydroxymyristoyl] glucosamine N-acyltransferase